MLWMNDELIDELNVTYLDLLLVLNELDLLWMNNELNYELNVE